MNPTEITPGVFLKICGITRLVDALHALQQGATALGFVFWPNSPRAIGPDDAREIIDALFEVTPKGEPSPVGDDRTALVVRR